MSQIEIYERRLQRERDARKQAEAIAESKTRELYEANRDLRALNDELEQRVAERTAELARTRDQAVASSQAKSAFLANMSHELRTPLNAIIGIAEMLVEEAEELGDAEAAEPLLRVRGAGKHLLALINEILDLSKIEAGKMEIHLSRVDLPTLLRDLLSTIEPLAGQNHNRLVLEVPDTPLVVRCDELRVRQMVLNLASNACKFSEHGTISLQLRRQDRNAEPGVLLTVSDSGIGMTRDQLASLFQEFNQLDSSTTRRFGGTGLGLAISQRFAHMMGGEISATSQPGEGSEFHLWLPLGLDEAVSEGTQAHAGSAHGAEAGPSSSRKASRAANETEAALERGKVVVIDDDPTVHEILHQFLAQEGFAMLPAGNGVDGLSLVRECRPNAVILDVLMPQLDGWTVLAALKGDPELQDIPVIMLTIVDDRSRAYALGAADYLVKPIDRKRLRKVLNERLGSRGNVLVIEDNPDDRRVTRELLRKRGFAVLEAAHGREALECMSAQLPDLILLDLLMPEMDGFEFIEQMHSHEDWRSIPIIVVTAKDLNRRERRCLQGRVRRVVSKGTRSRDQILAELKLIITDRHRNQQQRGSVA